MPEAMGERAGQARFGDDRRSILEDRLSAFASLVEIDEEGGFAGLSIFGPRPVLVHFESLAWTIKVKAQIHRNARWARAIEVGKAKGLDFAPKNGSPIPGGELGSLIVADRIDAPGSAVQAQGRGFKACAARQIPQLAALGKREEILEGQRAIPKGVGHDGCFAKGARGFYTIRAVHGHVEKLGSRAAAGCGFNIVEYVRVSV